MLIHKPSNFIIKITIYSLKNLKIDQYLDFALETAQKSLNFLEKDYIANDQIKFPKIGMRCKKYIIKYNNNVNICIYLLRYRCIT